MNAYYSRAAVQLLAKNLSELLFEEALSSQAFGKSRAISLNNKVTYHFEAEASIWGQWLIKPHSIKRNGRAAQCPLQLLIDAQEALSMSDIILANLLEETSNSLVADAQLFAKRASFSADAIANMAYDRQQAFLAGHPKAIANKGRMTWGLEEHQRYAPEHEPKIQLRWLACRDSNLQFGYQTPNRAFDLLKDSLDELDIANVRQQLTGDINDWHFIPVHPWQWSHNIQTHYAELFANGTLIDLGSLGSDYRPQQSLRTLANTSATPRLDIKLPLTILNTSCYRGIPGKYIPVGADLSQWLADLCSADQELENTIILREIAGVHLPHPLWQQINHAPYRYHELLGAIWREPVAKHLQANQQAVMLGALWQTDNSDTPLLTTWLNRAKQSLSDWLVSLFQHMVVPLYHLMCLHGVGLIAHGQNVTLILTDGRISGMALKDFQGDMRLDQMPRPAYENLSDEALKVLDKLPPEHLIHDLQTGNFVTALRFLSALCYQHYNFSEYQFYGLLAAELRAYQSRHPQLLEQFQRFDLFAETIPKLCINRVRISQGYEDSAERPRPILGANIENPLIIAEQAAAEPIVGVNHGI